MDFLERAAKTSIQKIEQLDRQIKLPSEDRTKSSSSQFKENGENDF